MRNNDETQFDVFICYRGQSNCSEFAARLNVELKKISFIHTFFAPEVINYGANFKTIIPSVMPHVRVMILLLGKGFFENCSKEDDIVTLELKTAISNPNLIILPIIFDGFSYETEDLSCFTSKETEAFKHNSAINYHGIYDAQIIDKTIIPSILNILRPSDFKSTLQKRRSNRYLGGGEDAEIDYLRREKKMLSDYDREVYDQIIDSRQSVLDIGCNDGSSTISSFGGYSTIKYLIGIDRLQSCIDKANEEYGNEQIRFYCKNLEDDDVDEFLNKIKREMGIMSFDLINITMVLLHLTHPIKLLRALRKHLSKDGILFIRDIDDTFNYAYPDPNGIFNRLGNIISYCDTYGYRNSGKEIYSYLKNCGFSKVKIAKQGINTAEMNLDEKETLFYCYYGFIPIAMKTMMEKNPDNVEIKGDAIWVNEIIDDALTDFLKNDFLFSLGYIIYLAQL